MYVCSNSRCKENKNSYFGFDFGIVAKIIQNIHGFDLIFSEVYNSWKFIS